ncbi:MAG: acyltransferase [Acutalibacteraceae bacterium]|jgi:acetyltransferase-like isoleucine patch superfamily enzyme
MSFWIWLERGYSMPQKNTLGGRISCFVGRRSALRNKNVYIPKSCLISPESRINPRNGEIRLGEKCNVAAGAILQGNIQMGNNSGVQANTIIVGYGSISDKRGLVKIGNNVRIASNVMIIAGNHVFSNPNVPISGQGLEYKPITIEDDVWVAGRVNIMAGVTIGKGSVIGAGAVVTKDIPPYSIAVGNPARVIKSRGTPETVQADTSNLKEGK